MSMDLTVCWIEEPASMFMAGSEGPHGIDVNADVSTKIIELSSYTMTNVAACGSISYVYSITSSTDAAFDPINDGSATFVDNVLTLSEI